MNPKSHWEQVYLTQMPTEVSWYQTRPSLSMRLITSTGIQKGDGVIDVGGEFALLETHNETHTTPWNTEQKFIYCRFQRCL